ncbi:MFS transporter [Actinophytocola sp.]|uniref:MFS transporter n=1 Tax=Actinophytocola sp. TaxID=1872138 RepID=UPI003D6A16C3
MAVVTAPTVWAPLRVRSYRNLLLGQSTSLLGDQLLVVTLPFMVLGTGGGPAGLGTVFAAYGMARVVALPVGGWVSDRLPKRAVLLASDLVRGLLVIGLLTGFGDGVPLIAGTVAVVGFAEGVFIPSSFAIVPSTVPPELLSRANALSGSAQNLAQLVGPGLGGMLAAAVDPRLCLGIDAATFGVSVLTLLFVRERPIVDARGTSAQTFGGFLRTSRLLRMVVGLTLVSNLAYFGMLEVALPVHSDDVSHTGAFGFGLALAGFGFGSFLGSLGIAALERRARRGLVACGLGAAQGMLFAAITFDAGLASTVVLMVLAGLSTGVLNVFYLSRVQEHVPEHLMGRAMSVLMLAVYAIHPVSVAAAAALTTAAGPGAVFAAAGLSIAVAFCAGAATRTYRDL